MLQVLGRASSINVRKVLWTCVEIGIDFEHVEWGSGDLLLHSPAFTSLNPNALVPVIKDGDFILWESNSICRYLATKHKREDLLPSAPTEHARIEQWMDWQATELNTSWRYAFMNLVRLSAKYADATARDESVENWNRTMGILNHVLAQTKAFVTGETFTLADIVLGLSTHRWYSTPMNRPNYRAIAGYYELLSTRQGFLQHGRNGHP